MNRPFSLFHLVLLFSIGLATSLGLVWIAVPYGDGSAGRARLYPPDHPVHHPNIIALTDMSEQDRCDAGDWRACLRESEYEPQRRGVLRARAEMLLDRECHSRNHRIHRIDLLPSCGQLALLKLESSPRGYGLMRRCLEEETRLCDVDVAIGDSQRVPENIGPHCNLTRLMPRELLLRDEWGDWCDEGDDFACRVEAAGARLPN